VSSVSLRAKIAATLQQWIQAALERGWLLPICALLSGLGTFTAAFPVTAIVLPAALLVPERWRWIAFSCALGSAIGATALVEFTHSIGLAQLNHWFPHLLAHQNWQGVQAWIDDYGSFSLFLIAATPLPQTPALILFGIAGHNGFVVFTAMLAGKILKYGLTAWLASRFPERFLQRLGLVSSEPIQEEGRDEKKH
jgi:membrane protein YqaA with SNARE-associated domain